MATSMGELLERRGVLLALPALALMGLFVVFPIVWNVYLSMTNFRLTGRLSREYDLVWLDNYVRLFASEEFRSAIVNSVLFTIFSAIIGQVVLGLALALLVRMSLPNNGLGRLLHWMRVLLMGLVFASWVIPEVVAGYSWLALTDKGGFFSRILGFERMYYEAPLTTIIIANIWRGTAFSMILFVAALESIPRYIYEAAEIDGAGPLYRFRHIVLPLLAPVILVDFILITIWTFNVFTQPFMILREALGSDVLWTIFVYKQAIKTYNPSMAAAASNIVFVIVALMILAYTRLLRRVRW